MIMGWDLGGAHLKAAVLDESGLVLDVVQLPCPLWQGLDQLENAISKALKRLPATRHHAITMTGELVDLFDHRAQGVAQIAQTCRNTLGPEVSFWAGDHFIGQEQTASQWRSIASANWLATAHFCALHQPDLVLMDMGSTTTDLAIIAHGKVKAQALEDGDRLIRGEMIYTGVVRTPLMALGPTILFRGQTQGIAAEMFATTADVYRLLGETVHDHYPTADGKGTSDEDCARRIARMVGRDLEDATLAQWRELAQHFADRQCGLIGQALTHLLTLTPLPADAPLVGAGQGAFNAHRLALAMQRPYRDITDFLNLSPKAHQFGQTAVTAIAVAMLGKRLIF